MRIIIGIDGSHQATAGLRWVESLPLSSDDEVLIATVVDRPILLGTWGYLASDLDRGAMDRAGDAAAEESRRLTEHARDELGDLPCHVSTLVLDGHPIEALERAAGEHAADLLVVGPRGRGRLESILLGSVSDGLLHRMPAAVLIAREPVSPPVRVLLATDGSSHSLAAGGYLARFPLPAEAVIEVVAVSGDWIGLQASEERTWASEAIDATIAALGSGDKRAAPIIRQGNPTREILEAAQEFQADLLVTGSRGHGGFAGLVLGSVSRALAKAAPCSVLVVPSGLDAAH